MSENAFVTQLPEDIRSEPSLQAIQDVGSLAKSYVNAQKLIGAKRLVAPSEGWGESQWNEFYDSIGRPKTPDDYKLPEVKFEEGLAIDDSRKKEALSQLHKMGLTQRQAAGVLEYYFNSMNNDYKTVKSKQSEVMASGTAALKQEWGDKFDANLDIARSTIKKFGGDEISTWLDKTGLGNDPTAIKLFHKVGLEFMEDARREGGAGGSGLPLGDQARATQEIEQLKLDLAFQRSLGDSRDPGHRAAIDRWMSLFKIAFPGTEQG